MASSVGKKVTLRYIATINGVDVDSFVQEVNVQVIQPSNLPQPLINNLASGGTLDLTTFTGNATASVAKWRLSATGQRVWLICSSAGVGDLYVLNGAAITATEAANGLVNKTVVRTWLAALSTGSQITVMCKVTFDGSTNEAQAVNFATTIYTMANTQKLEFSSVPAAINGTICTADPGWPQRSKGYIPSQLTGVRGGIPPYTATSSDTSVVTVSVNATTVRYYGSRLGNATVTISDSSNPAQSISFIARSNTTFRHLLYNGNLMNDTAAASWVASVGVPLVDSDGEFLKNNFEPGQTNVFRIGTYDNNGASRGVTNTFVFHAVASSLLYPAIAFRKN